MEDKLKLIGELKERFSIRIVGNKEKTYIYINYSNLNALNCLTTFFFYKSLNTEHCDLFVTMGMINTSGSHRIHSPKQI